MKGRMKKMQTLADLENGLGFGVKISEKRLRISMFWAFAGAAKKERERKQPPAGTKRPRGN